MLKSLNTKLELQDEYQEFHKLLDRMASTEGNVLDSYIKDSSVSLRASLLNMRNIRKVELFDGKVVPRQYLNIKR